MKALLWHRLSMQKWYILLLLIISLSITFINLHFFSASSIVIFALIFSATIVESMYTQDHKAKWELFVNSLPLTKKMQLQADYLYCYGLMHYCLSHLPLFIFHRFTNIAIASSISLFISQILAVLFCLFVRNFIHTI